MSTLKDIVNQYLEDISSDFLNQFKVNNAYKILCDINRSRCAIKLYQIDRRFIYEEHHRSKFKYFDNLGYMYIQAPIKYLMVGERLYQKEIKKIRYNLMTLDELNGYFQNTFDLFDEQGIKIRRSTIKVALYDEYIMIQIPNIHKDNKIFNVLMYPHILNKEANVGVFKIRKSSFNYNINELLVYVDGKNTKNYSITENDINYVIRINDDIKSHAELSFIRFIKNETASFKNDHLFLKQQNLPIPNDSIISFYNGKLINLKLSPVTGCIFKSSLLLNNNNFNVYYGYSEEFGDIYKYYDNYLWYYNYNKKTPEIINNSRLLPEFINDFSLYNKDISLEDFLKNGYSDIIKYNIDKINNILNYNEEMLPILLYFIKSKLNNFVNQYTQTFVIKDYETEYNTRLDNTTEQLEPSKQIKFLFDTILFKFKNNNHTDKIINVYIDGIKYYGFRHIDIVNDNIYMYIDKDKVINASEVSFEIINVSYVLKDNYKEIKLISNETNHIEINNVSKVGLIKNIEDIFYLKCIINGKLIYIKDIDYDKSKDIVTILFENNLPKGTLLVFNSNTYKNYKHNTSRNGANMIIDINDIRVPDINNIRVYKSGRELPRDKYKLIQNKNNYSVQINCQYTVCEQLEVEYIPNKIIEKYGLDNVNNDGKIDIYENSKKEMFFNNLTDYYCLNGRRLGQTTCKQWCTKGVTLHGLNTDRYFRAYEIEIPILIYILNKFINGYKINEKLFDKFIIGIMKGNLDITSTNTETDCDKANSDNSNSLYNDIYREFLRHNIIDSNMEIPQYIAIKYNDLINQDGVFIINSNDKDKSRWMPLDANMPRKEQVVKIEDLYYELINGGESVKVLNGKEIPKEIYDKYKILFDNNVLVLQVPYIEDK